MGDTLVTHGEILAALRLAGIAAGDTLMVHSSLKSFGRVEGGPETVIDVLLEAVGAGGHVVMPTLTATYVRGGPRDSGLAFHPARTPSRVGLITDRFWRRPGAVRSEHPTHSLACIGPRAQVWMAGHGEGERPTFGGWEGPYARYVRSEGGPSKLIFLGVTMTCNTTLHAVEAWLGLPYLGTARARVERDDGTVEEVEVTQAPLGARGFYHANDRHHQKMDQEGRIKRVQAGRSTILVLEARACVAETVRQELETPGALLSLDPKCQFSTEGRARILTIQNQIQARAKEIRARGLSD